MRKTVHLCLSSHDEIMFRSEEDLNVGFNCLAAAVLETESRLMAEGFMTTHSHYLLQTDYFKQVIRLSRYAYARYFNAKYSRKGRLGERKYFVLEINGLHHTLSASNYVIRQGLHHGLASTPFGYEHCSANALFRKELGKTFGPPLLPDHLRHRFLPSHSGIPAKYRMSESGLLLREDIIDTAYVEEIYISPRNFLFQMNRIAGEEDFRKQRDENGLPPVTMETIENGVSGFNLARARVFEQGKVDKSKMTDLELCNLVDNAILPRYSKNGQRTSVYLLPESRRAEIAENLWRESSEVLKWHKRGGPLQGKTVTENQLRRCLIIR